MDKERNEARYREMSVPFANKDEALEAANKFLQGVKELRISCKIPDVYMVFTLGFMQDGEEVHSVAPAHFGNELNRQRLAAFGYGYEKASSAATLAAVIADAERIARSERD